MVSSDRNNYIKRLETKLERIDRESSHWLERARQPFIRGGREQRLQVTALRNQIARLRADLRRLSARTCTTWSDEKIRLDRAWNDVKAAYQSTMRNFL